jgi:long-chain acyl-CoA synthetase
MSHSSQPSMHRNQDYEKLLADYQAVQSLPEVWAIAARQFADIVALQNPHSQPEIRLTYAELYQQLQQFAAGLQALGVKPDVGEAETKLPCIALFADNSPRWFIADQGSMMAGAVNVVRSSQADPLELRFILEDSQSQILIAENQTTLQKILTHLTNLPIRLIILLSDETPNDAAASKVVNFSQVLQAGVDRVVRPVPQDHDSLATLMYTSGTTGKPKGVMVSHGGLLSQIASLRSVVQPQPGDRVLSILPTWHAFERVCEYFLLAQGCTQIYTNLRQVKQDIKTFKPQYMIGVPRLWDSIYEGVQKQFRQQPPSKQRLIHFFFSASQRYIEARRIAQGLNLEQRHPSGLERLLAEGQMLALWPLHQLGDRLVYQQVREATGGQFKQLISGGGSLSMHLDNFYEIVGIEMLVGYGLTETAVVLSARRTWHNLRGSSGKPLHLTEIRIVDPETRQPLPPEKRGLVMARGPQIMQGYYQNPEATAKAIDPAGWFDTGDLGWLTDQQDLVLTGRAKDTIVLSNGENIEPQPIEDACLRSPYIDQIVVVGQDQRSLGALIVPNLEALQKWALEQNYLLKLPQSGEQFPEKPTPDLQPIGLDSKLIQDLFRQELNREVKNRPGYRADDRIGPFRLILEPFSIENGMMTQTLKIRRSVVVEHYRDMIDGMFD